jgi:hypothetical protein
LYILCRYSLCIQLAKLCTTNVLRRLIINKFLGDEKNLRAVAG